MDFRGASAEAVEALTGELRTAVSDKPEAAAAAAGSLYSAAQTFRDEPALRRFATDASVPAEGKAGLVKEIFAGKVEGPALDILAGAVGHRWTHGGDLPDGIERLSEVASVLSAGDGSALSDELFELRRTVDHSPQLRDALSDPSRTSVDKAALIDSLFEGKVQPATLSLAKQALGGSYGTVSAALGAYRTVAGETNGSGVATVSVAKPLTDEQTSRLAAALQRQYGRPVHANVVVDPAVVGGIRVEIGDDIIDGTVSGRLDDAARRLAG